MRDIIMLIALKDIISCILSVLTMLLLEIA
jgi:hypothetical protein